jgi:hypothetical protein
MVWVLDVVRVHLSGCTRMPLSAVVVSRDHILRFC